MISGDDINRDGVLEIMDIEKFKKMMEGIDGIEE